MDSFMIRACLFALFVSSTLAADHLWESIAGDFQPPAEYAGQFGDYATPLKFKDGRSVTTPEEWQQRRHEILQDWHTLMGEWPPLVTKPHLEVLETTHRENFTQHRIRLQIAPEQTGEGYLLIPDGKGPFPAVFVPFYEPETSIGLAGKPLRDFAHQLTLRGFVTLSIGSPGGDARKPILTPGAQCQPLSYLGYVSANAWTALSQRPEVDAKRIGIMGHSYGGKWAMFGACLWDKYACGVWSDPGIVFDETRNSINYQEPWYLGLDPNMTRKPGLITADNPRTGVYKTLIEKGHDLVEFQALMAPRPFLVSGGAEDPPKRWVPLNHLIRLNHLLGQEHGVAMTNRPDHSPTEDSNEHVYRFLEWALKPAPPSQ
ncbi:MAG: prolyl oligopeptidase family serine peptidase [Prosthecobacter sp.]|nr:prolyl oligopeptidase family serine peptidase [Prosthecobacter sp.]